MVINKTIHDVRIMESSKLKKNALYVVYEWKEKFSVMNNQTSIFHKAWRRLKKTKDDIPSTYIEPTTINTKDTKPKTVVTKAKELIIKIYKAIHIWEDDKVNIDKYVLRVKSYQKKLLEEVLNDNKEKDLALVLDILKELPLLMNKIQGKSIEAKDKFLQMYKAVKSDYIGRCRSMHKIAVSNEEVKSRATNKSFLDEKAQMSRDSSKTDVSAKEKKPSSKVPTFSKPSTSVQRKSNKSPTSKKVSPVAIQKVEVDKKVYKTNSSVTKTPHKLPLDNSKKTKTESNIATINKDIAKEQIEDRSINITNKKDIVTIKNKEEIPLSMSELIKGYNEKMLKNINEVQPSIAFINPSSQEITEEQKAKAQEEGALLNSGTNCLSNEINNRFSNVSFGAPYIIQEDIRDKELVSSIEIDELGGTLLRNYEEKNELEETRKKLEEENIRVLEQYNLLHKEYQNFMVKYNYTKLELARTLQNRLSILNNANKPKEEINYNKENLVKLNEVTKLLNNAVNTFEQQNINIQKDLEILSKIEAELKMKALNKPFKVAFKSVKMKKPLDSPDDSLSSSKKDYVKDEI